MTGRTVSEIAFQDAVAQYARFQGWAVAHFRPARSRADGGWRTPVAYDARGWPDLVLVRERVLFRELKSARGKVDADQQAWLDRLAAAGQDVGVWRPKDWGVIEATLARDFHHPTV